MDDSLYRDHADFDEGHWWFEGRRRIIADVLRRHLRPGGGRRLVDIGCGTGGMLPMLSAFGEVSGLDLSQEAVAECRARYGESFDVRVGTVSDSPHGDPDVDVISAFDVIEHIHDDVSALTELRAALRPGGTFVCTVPAFEFLWSEHDDLNHHKRRYTRARLEQVLLEAGFEVVETSYFNTWLFPVVAAVRVLRRLIGKTSGTSDLAMPHPAINRLLAKVLASERFVLRRGVALPVGVSLIAVAVAPLGPCDSSLE